MDATTSLTNTEFTLNLLWQYMHRMVEGGGLYEETQQGISRGCPLSPLIGAFFLSCLDAQFQHEGLFYVRYMDDILIFAPTRWKIRRAVKRLNETFTALKLEKHPSKTFIGRIDKGFDFLGYQFSPNGLSVAEKTLQNFVARLRRLYEQKKTAPDLEAVLGDYLRRWLCWVPVGIGKSRCVFAGTPIRVERLTVSCSWLMRSSRVGA
jgi:RNA-directed DNA polymerase